MIIKRKMSRKNGEGGCGEGA